MPEEIVNEKEIAEKGRSFLSAGPGSFRLWISFFLLLVIAVLFVMVRDLDVEASLIAIRDLGPVPFFLALAFLPSVGFPTTPFFLIAGAAFGAWLSIAAAILSQAFNLAFCYWLARRYFRELLERVVARIGYRVPQVKKENYLKAALLIRIPPGPPNFLKNYIMGLAGIPFRVYFLVSLPATAVYGIGMIVLGDSLLARDWRQGILGIAILIVLLVSIKLFRNYLTRRKENPDLASG